VARLAARRFYASQIELAAATIIVMQLAVEAGILALLFLLYGLAHG
jgi:hypothetical protein